MGKGGEEKEGEEGEGEKGEEKKRRAARKEYGRVREMARDSYSGGGTRERCGWDLQGLNGSSRSGSGKLRDKGGSRSGRQAG